MAGLVEKENTVTERQPKRQPKSGLIDNFEEYVAKGRSSATLIKT